MALPNLYQSSSLILKLNRQKKNYPQRKPLCLFSDLDDTYILKYWPSEEILETNSQKVTDTILSPDLTIYDETILLKRFLDDNNIPLIAVSGRDLFQMKELRSKFIKTIPSNPEIMDFDAIIGAVGTEIYIKTNDSYRLDSQFEKVCSKTSYNKEALYTILESLIPIVRKKYSPIAFDFCKRDKKDSIDELPTLPYKISYEFKSDEQNAHLIIQMISENLSMSGYGFVKILWSSPYAIDKSINKYNVDIVPVSKDIPVLYLKKLLDLTVIVAGDSGNDFEMLTNAADIAIVVGNAKKELIDLISPLLQKNVNNSIMYLQNEAGPKAILKAISRIMNSS